MNNRLYTVLLLFVLALMLAAAVIALRMRPHFQQSGEEAESGSECGVYGGGEKDEPGAEATDSRPAKNRSKSGKSLDERNNANSEVVEMRNEVEEMRNEVEEMRNEVEEMVRKFRGTPEERQEVIEECEGGKELIRLFADLSESSIEKMSPEELEKERENFEKEYRAQLDLIQSGELQQMLETPEEEEVIGSTIEAVQEFLERIDDALQSAGY